MLFTYLVKHSDLKLRIMLFKFKFLPFNQSCFVGVYSGLLVVFNKTIFIISPISEHSKNSHLPLLVVLTHIILLLH